MLAKVIAHSVSLRAGVTKWMRIVLCGMNGGHVLYIKFDRTPGLERIYQECLCGYETHGWHLSEEPHDQSILSSSEADVRGGDHLVTPGRTPRAQQRLAS